MKATCSITTGVCLFGTAESSIKVICAVPDVYNDGAGYLSLSTITDWAILDAPDEARLLQQLVREHHLVRTTSLLEECVLGLSAALERDVLEHVNEDLQSRVSPESVSNRLLRAPLQSPDRVSQLAAAALGLGYAAVAHVLEQVVDLQPLLRRFIAIWHETPDALFVGLAKDRRYVWQSLVETNQLLRLLESPTYTAFMNSWNSLVFLEHTVAVRSTLSKIGADLARRMEMGADPVYLTEFDSDDDSDVKPELVRRESGYALRDRALKQVTAIGEAVSRGDDLRAREYLTDLMATQIATPDHLVKSLCNIAKQCADMFRTDFERECLLAALELAPADTWTLIQLGDHYKRIGDYNAALEVLNRAKWSDPGVIAESNIADVFAQQGDFDGAIARYLAIPNWQGIAEIRTAVADNLRRKGDLDEAEQAYDALLLDGMQSDRSVAGRAEIAKRRGNLQDARALYEELVQQRGLDEQTRRIYRLALAGVLKQMGRLDESYRLIDEVIRAAPFDKRARILRASIVGLLGNAAKALNAFSTSHQMSAFGEWVQHYYRGLLLLKLSRYEEARHELIANLTSSLLLGEERAFMRMAAAVFFLANGDADAADGMLVELPVIKNKYAEYLALTLRFHVAVSKKDNDRIKELARELQGIQISDPQLIRIREHIIRRELHQARLLEIDALLRLAA
jgi:tetratricopeptide (TPR) repeat protein